MAAATRGARVTHGTRRLVAIASLVVALGALSACGGDATPDADRDGSDPAVEPAPEPERFEPDVEPAPEPERFDPFDESSAGRPAADAEAQVADAETSVLD